MKMILAAALVTLIFMGLLTYGYLVYSINSEATGAPLVEKHKALYYTHLVIQLLQLGTGVVVAYKT